MKKTLFLAFTILLFAACDSTPKFTVTGTVTDAEGKMLYMEATQLQGVVQLDSVKLKSNGKFKFQQPQPDAPDFYRLRIDNRIINFSVDADETITVNAPFNGFAKDYSVEGSPNSEKIKELVLKQIRLQEDVNALIAAARNRKIKTEAYEDSLMAMLKSYKDEVKMEYIFAEPNKTPAYFALFQKINDYLIFDPMNSKDDLKCFQAVATSMDVFHPHAIRSKNLRNLTIKGLQNNREPREKVIEIPEDKISETGVIDIALRDLKGDVRRLTELKGKVILLDFTVYQSQMSTPHNFLLSDLYEKYKEQGLEIYQVSLDADEHFWKTVAGNLPWICVRDPNGIYSTYAGLYNLQGVPSFFLINKKNELSARGENVKDMEAAIKGLL